MARPLPSPVSSPGVWLTGCCEAPTDAFSVVTQWQWQARKKKRNHPQNGSELCCSLTAIRKQMPGFTAFGGPACVLRLNEANRRAAVELNPGRDAGQGKCFWLQSQDSRWLCSSWNIRDFQRCITIRSEVGSVISLLVDVSRFGKVLKRTWSGRLPLL